MGNCASDERKDVTLLAVGLDNAGKTTTVHAIKGEANSNVAPTVGFSSIDLKSGDYNVKIFDLGGGAWIRGIWNSYMAETFGIIFIVDSSDVERMEECRKAFDDLISDSRLRGKPVLILANKQDKPDAIDELDLCNRLSIDEIVNRNECFSKVILCSAFRGNKKSRTRQKLDRGIKNGFDWLMDMIEKDYETLKDRVFKDTNEQKKHEAEERRLRNARIAKIQAERERFDNSHDSVTMSTAYRPRPEGISSEELPNDNSKILQSSEQNISLQNKPQVSGLNGALLEDDSDNDGSITVLQHHHTLSTASPQRAVFLTNNIEVSDKNELQSHEEIISNPNSRSLSAASLRNIVKDTPTDTENFEGDIKLSSSDLKQVVSIASDTQKSDTTLLVSVTDTLSKSVESTQLVSGLLLNSSAAIDDRSEAVVNVDSDSKNTEKRRKKKKRRKKNKINPNADEIGSIHSVQSDSIQNITVAPKIKMRNPSYIPPSMGIKPNFDSDVEV